MKSNPYFISIAVGFLVFIAVVLTKRAKSEDVQRSDILKIAAVVSALTFCALHIYEKPSVPVLAEPFISSCES